MKKLTIFTLVLLCYLPMHGQFGVKGAFSTFSTPDWVLSNSNSTISNDRELLQDGWSVGIDYWFRLKNYRLEFTPELNLSNTSTTIDGNQFSTQFYSFFFNANIYPFDFSNDCDCPTFSKQGPTLEKGFFLQLSPGVSYLDQSITTNELESSTNDISISIGLGVGYDIGVSDLVTITPTLKVRYFPAANWDITEANLEAISSFEQETAITQLSAGLRIGIRLDDQY